MLPRVSTSLVIAALLPLLAACSLISANCSYNVRRAVEQTLDADSRNEDYSLNAYCKYPDTLILDLSKVSSVSPSDLLRGIFQSSEALHEADKEFDKIILAREGKFVFFIKGSDFQYLGAELKNGQNPVYLVRTFPEKLYRPDGGPAFPRRDGGWLYVFGKQMEDVSQAAKEWIMGGRPGR